MKNARRLHRRVQTVRKILVHHLKGRATIRGVGFVDFLHGHTGVASNGIELQPVVKFTDGTCQRTADAEDGEGPPGEPAAPADIGRR